MRPLPTSRRDASRVGEQSPAGSFSLPAGGVPLNNLLAVLTPSQARIARAVAANPRETSRIVGGRLGMHHTSVRTLVKRVNDAWAPFGWRIEGKSGGAGYRIIRSENEATETVVMASLSRDAAVVAFAAARDEGLTMSLSERIARRVEEACR